VLAVVLVVATLTFGSSLTTLVSHPALYGWNWTYALSDSNGYGNIPQQQVGTVLRGSPDAAAWTSVSFVTADVDGQAVPVLLGSPHAVPTPPVLSGHPVDGRDQIVLGPATLAQLHQHLGGTVTAAIDQPGSVIRARLIIVGTATLPAVGVPQGLHTSMGTGALASNPKLRLVGRVVLGVTWCFACPGGVVFWLLQGERDRGTDEAECLALGAGGLGEPGRGPVCSSG
jgi:hypothetical protein